MTQTSTTNTNRQLLYGVLFCFLFFIACTMINTPQVIKLLGIQKSGVGSLLLSRFAQWFCLLVIMLYAIRIEKQRLLLWENRKYKIHYILLHVLLLYITAMLIIIPVKILLSLLDLHEVSPKMGYLKSILKAYPLMLPFICITAGIVEEYIFRGYIQPRLEMLFKSPVMSIIVTSLMFGAIHFGYGTFDALVGPFIIGLIFSFYYWKYRNIYVLILCHTLIDLIALYSIVNSSRF